MISLIKKFLVFLSLLGLFMVAGCYDMQYEDMEEYYDYFDNTVYLKYIDEDGKSFKSTSANLEENFLNKHTQKDFSEECLIDGEYYAYLAVSLGLDEEAEFDDLCLYLRTEKDALMEIRIYIVDELPSKGRGFNAEQKDVDKQYDDEYINPIATEVANLKSGEFRDIFIRKWTVDGKEVKKFTLKPDQYLLIQFYNNTGYGYDDGYSSVKFTMTDFVLSKVAK